MAFGGIKNYSLVHLDFRKQKYFIFYYQKDRRLTANQAWKLIRNENPDVCCKLSSKANIDTYFDILAENDLDIKHCDRYMTLG